MASFNKNILALVLLNLSVAVFGISYDFPGLQLNSKYENTDTIKHTIVLHPKTKRIDFTVDVSKDLDDVQVAIDFALNPSKPNNIVLKATVDICDLYKNKKVIQLLSLATMALGIQSNYKRSCPIKKGHYEFKNLNIFGVDNDLLKLKTVTGGEVKLNIKILSKQAEVFNDVITGQLP